MTAGGRPAVSPPRPWTFPAVGESRLDNGVRVLAYPLPGQYVVAAHLVLDVPLDAEPRDLEGVATLAARTLDEGTTRHPAEQYAERLETEGAGLGIDVGLSGLQVVLDVPAARLGTGLDLLVEAVADAVHADADVDRHRSLRLAEIEQARANSAQLASAAFRSAVFDAASRASRMTGGEPETVSRVGGAEVRDFRGALGPAGSTLVLAGDFAEDPEALAARTVGSWIGSGGGSGGDGSAPGRSERRARLLHRPGAVAADLRLGGFGVDRKDPRWAALTVAGYAMGGAFLSRLNRVLREERGYTYGVRMAFGPLRAGGSYAVQGSFRTEVLAAALLEARTLLDVSAAPFTAEEVRSAVDYFTGVAPLRYATADGVAEQVASLVLADLPLDHVDTFADALRAVTPEEATEAFTSVVDLDDLTLVVVGDADVLADPVRAAGYDDLEVTEPPAATPPG